MPPPSVPGAGALRWADFDQDGDSDVLINSAPGPSVHIFLNDGSGHYTDGGAASPSIGVGLVEVADIDDDGDVDFILVGPADSAPNSPTRRLYRNDHNPPSENCKRRPSSWKG